MPFKENPDHDFGSSKLDDLLGLDNSKKSNSEFSTDIDPDNHSKGSTVKDSTVKDTSYNDTSHDDSQENKKTNIDETNNLEEAQSEQETHTKSTKKKSSSYNPDRVREFLIRVAKAVKRHQARVDAHNKYHEHIKSLHEKLSHSHKEQSTSKQKKSKPSYNPDQEIEELKKRVQHLVQIEKNPNLPDNSTYVKEKIIALENKLNTLLESKEQREKRFKELEKKVNKRFDADQELIHELEKKLLIMERNLLQHQINNKKSRKKTDPKTINEIKTKISKTKNALQLAKQKTNNDSSFISKELTRF